MVCVLKEKEFLRNIQEKDSGKNGIKKKKKSNSKKVEKVIPVSAGEEIKRPLGQRKKQTETNEDMVDKRMKKKMNVIQNQKINKKQQIDEEYNEDKKQQNIST